MMIKKNMRFLTTNISTSIFSIFMVLGVLGVFQSFAQPNPISQQSETNDKYASSLKKYRSISIDTTKSIYDIATAYFSMGHYFAHGHSVGVNVDSALFYLNRAASLERQLHLNSYSAIRFLSFMYYSRRYGIYDLDKSLELLIESANLGDIKSNLELGELYLSGCVKQLKDTTIYEDGMYPNGQAYLAYRVCVTPTKMKLCYPSLEIDSIRGYYYYERGIDVNRKLVNAEYVLQDMDFVRAYMDGPFSDIDFTAAFNHLQGYISEDDLIYSDDDSDDAGEAYWRLQILFRFGLGTRTNKSKANIYLSKSAACGYKPAIDALNYCCYPIKN